MTVAMNVLLPAVTALAGVVVGAGVSIFRDVWRSRAEHRRQRMRLAVQLAIEQHRMWMEVGKTRSIETPPLLITLLSQVDILADIADDREITPQRLAQLHTRSRTLHDALRALNEMDSG